MMFFPCGSPRLDRSCLASRVAPEKAGREEMNDRTPIVVGVGEASERIDAPDWRAMSPADLAGAAARAALEDARAPRPLAGEVDVMASIRQFETSGPRAMAPFGRADNFPRAVAKRI